MTSIKPLEAAMALLVFLMGMVAKADYVVDFENVDLTGVEYTYNPAINGISIESSSPWGAIYAVSRKTDLTDVNAYWTNGDDTAVAIGGADSSEQWFSAYNFSPGDIVFATPTDTTIQSAMITNTALVDYTVRNGLFQARAFQPNDFLRVRFLGLDQNNAPTGLFTPWIDIASYGTSLFVLANWITVDLSRLNSNRIGFEFEGSDVDPTFGLNTPALLAFDRISVSVVPEPSSLALIVTAIFFSGLRYRNRHS